MPVNLVHLAVCTTLAFHEQVISMRHFARQHFQQLGGNATIRALIMVRTHRPRSL